MRQALRGRVGDVGTATIVIDDIQWADRESMAVVAQLARALGPQLSVIATDRGGHDRESPWNRNVVVIPPVRWSAAVELVRTIRPKADAALVNEIVSGANGLPFVLKTLALGHDDAAAGGSLEAALRLRLDRCRPRVMEILCIAACVPAPIPSTWSRPRRKRRPRKSRRFWTKRAI